MIIFNPQNSLFASQVSNDLGNIRFFQEGAELNSWCESGCNSSSTNATFWVVIPSEIGANSVGIINMAFLPTNTEYDGAHAGEAPELSNSYAKYDSGPYVFNFYDNFTGSSLNAALWSQAGSSSGVSVSDGLTISGTGSWSYIYSNHALDPQIYTQDAYAYKDNLGSHDFWYGLEGVSSSGFLGSPFYVWTSDGGVYSLANYDGVGYYGFAYSGSSNNADYSVFSEWITPNQSYGTVNYADKVGTSTYFTPITSGVINAGVLSPPSDLYMKWIRERITPPNGIMPSVSFSEGNDTLIVTSPSPATQSIHQTESANMVSEGAIGGSPSYAYQWLATTAGGSVFTAAEANSICSDAQALFCLFDTNASTGTGIYQFKISVTDSASNSATSGAANILLTALPLSVSMSPENGTIRIGSFGNFASSVSGGIPPYHYSWSTNAPFIDCLNTANPVNPYIYDNVSSCAFSTYSQASGYSALPKEGVTLLSGNYLLSLTVTDNGISSATANSVVTVTEASNELSSPSINRIFGSDSPTGYYNITLANNANIPTNATAPILIIGGCPSQYGVYCPNPTPSGTANGNRVIFFWDNGTIINSWLYPVLSLIPSAWELNMFYYIRLGKSIGANQSITIHMGLAPNSQTDYTSLCSNVEGFTVNSIPTEANIICASSGVVGEQPFLASTYGSHDNGQSVFNQYDSFISNGTDPYSYQNYVNDWNSANVTHYGNGITFNGTLISKKGYNNLGTLIITDAGTNFGYGTMSTTNASGYLYDTYGYRVSYLHFATNGTYSCLAGEDYAQSGLAYLGGYNQTYQQYVDNGYGLNYYASSGTLCRLSNSLFVGSYPIEFTEGGIGIGSGASFIAVMGKSAQTPSVNFAPVAYSLDDSHPFGMSIAANDILLGQNMSFNITVLNGTYHGAEPYDLSYTIMNRSGSCATSPTYGCMIYEGTSVITNDGTPQAIVVTTNQIATYSGNVPSIGDYSIFATVQKGLAAMAQGYANFAVACATNCTTNSTTNSTLHYSSEYSISIANNQSSATGSNFQQMIHFNPTNSLFTGQIASNLGNIRFSQGVSELHSWCESGCASSSSNAVFWVLLPDGIGADSNTIINMSFLPTNTEYDGVYAGEAPELSASYAEYDNGPNVFSFYDNFTGTSLNSQWTNWVVGGCGSFTVQNGISSTGGSEIGCSSTTNFNDGTTTVDFYGNSIPNPDAGLGVGFINLANSYYLSTEAANNPTYWAIRSASTVVAGSTALVGSAKYVFSTWDMSGTGYSMANYITLASVSDSVDTAVPITFWKYDSNTFIQWIRARTTPPNGIMPTATFENVA